MKRPKILDTTLRDGSYVIDFKFTSEQTYQLSKVLDEANFPYIEVGHGVGLGATKRPGMLGACSDEACMEVASGAITKNKWGMFFIPGIGTKDDIDLACKYNMDFIRIGANVDAYDKAEPYVRYAKEKGMLVFANFMKTYALSYEEVGKVAKQASNYGADINCIVDSAGAMLPIDVEGYVKAIRNETDTQIGFHGHNNLGLANINSIRALELGVEVIDTSLRGMGRSAGNTVTEIFLLTLSRMGIDLGYDIYKVLDISEKYIDPLMKGYRQVDSESIIAGYAKFHSSFSPLIHKVSEKHKIDPRKLIVEFCKIDCLNAHENLVEQIALTIK
jgi:4-hydroxy 2-oxovalerate aldolase